MAKLFISNQRMLELWDWAKKTGLVINDEDWCDRIGFVRPNKYNIEGGSQSFSKEHILNAAKFTGANINWIYGLENNMLRKPQATALEMLKQAVIAVENEWKDTQKKVTLKG